MHKYMDGSEDGAATRSPHDHTWRVQWRQVASMIALPIAPERFDRMRGHERAKRAIEIAIAGAHTLTLIALGSGAAIDATLLARWGNDHGTYVVVADPCFCGNRGSADVACVCSPRAVRGFARTRTARAAGCADMLFVVHPPGYTAIASDGTVESDETVWTRIQAARVFRAEQVMQELPQDSGVQSLLRVAARTMGTAQSSYRYQRTLAVAHTIAALDGAAVLRPCHVAEALAYRTSLTR